MKNFEKNCLSSNATIRQALETINESSVQFIIVVDSDLILQGVVSDGDLRKAILRGDTLETPLKDFMAKEPLTLPPGSTRNEILRLMQSKGVRHIPIVDENKKVLDLFQLHELVAKSTRGLKAVLMAGGKGTRLKPLTNELPKPMVQLGGQPVLEIIIKQLMTFGIDHFFITTNYLGDLIKDHFKDGSELNCRIDYVEEPKELGTAGSLKYCENNFKEPFLVMNADVLTKCNIESLLETHEKNLNTLTIAVKTYSKQVPYGVVELEGNGEVKGLIEKPSKEYLINTGIYVLSPEALKEIPENTYTDMPELIRNLMEKGKKVGAYKFENYWKDIGNISDYERANEDIVAGTFSTRERGN